MTTRTSVVWAVVCAAAVAAGSAAAQTKNDEGTKTYTGCVEPGQQAGSYVLTHVTTADTAAAGAETKQSQAPDAIDLASASVKIGPHSGHKVTVTGKTMQHESQTMLMVDSLKMVSRTCP
jgi:hypothetical protein